MDFTDEDEEDVPRCRRSRSTSFYFSDTSSADAIHNEDESIKTIPSLKSARHANGASRGLRRREIKALEDGLEFQMAGRCYRQQHAIDRIASTSIDSSDSTSDSDVERRADTPRPNYPASKHRKVKLLMLGHVGVGKTSLVQRWTANKFDRHLIGTAGVDFCTKRIVCSVWDDAHRVYNDETVTVQIWDTAGQERFHVITRSYYKGCQGILLVYDALNATSEKLDYWLKNVADHADEDVKVGVLCNKIDLVPPGRVGQSGHVISGQQAATAQNFPLYLTSAKSGSGVDDAFRSIVEDILSSERGVQLTNPSNYTTPKSKVGLSNCKPFRRRCVVS